MRGELGARFVQSLRRQLERGTYDPHPAYIVAASKSDVATRPAALLSLEDRVVFAALVAAVGPRIDSYLLGSDLVFWPRGTAIEKRWLDFERSVLLPQLPYVMRGDIVGFYEFVDHERLAQAIVSATGQRDFAEALTHFLGRVMNSRHGLPQGLLPSDALATLYLADLDFAMAREGFQYSRHGDDVRIGTKTYRDGRRAIRTLETELRKLGLVANSSKTRILRRATYEREVSSLQGVLRAAHEQIVADKIQTIVSDEEKLLEAMAGDDLNQLAWDFFYHGRVSLTDVIEQLRPRIEPSVTELATAVFLDAVRKRPGRANAINFRLFHQRLRWSLVRLAASRSAAGLEHIGILLRSFPAETEVLCSYLSALAPSEPAKVAEQAEKAIHGGYLTEWELAPIVQVLTQVPEHVSVKGIRVLRRTLESPHGRWLAGVEIAKLLAARQELERDALMRMANTCPAVLRVDLVIAAKWMKDSAQWARAFVETARADRIQAVVAKHPDV